MDEAEIKRLRKAIRRSFGSSPHKKKYWLALLEMHVAKEKAAICRVRGPASGSGTDREFVDYGR